MTEREGEGWREGGWSRERECGGESGREVGKGKAEKGEGGWSRKREDGEESGREGGGEREGGEGRVEKRDNQRLNECIGVTHDVHEKEKIGEEKKWK